jgi:hypothetical protein
MKHQPLAEIFGFPFDNLGKNAGRFRKLKLCPFGNVVPNCTKDKAKNPLGVCSIFDGKEVVIVCPIRFRENWIIAEDAANFFFDEKVQWTTLTEVRLPDKYGRSAGNIDVVIAAYDDGGKVIDFGALEVQAVYISGNIRDPFEGYIKETKGKIFDWSGRANYPKPDYLSSSRKRLAPQLIYKGGIIRAWNKKTAVALNKGFFETLPKFREVSKGEADIAWMVYGLRHEKSSQRFRLSRDKIVYAKFEDSLSRITKSEAGSVENFIGLLQDKINEKLESKSHPPSTEKMDAPF